MSRSELAAHWVQTLKAASARVGNAGRGRGGHWAVAGRDPELREVEREFIRRLHLEAEARDSLASMLELAIDRYAAPAAYRCADDVRG